MAENIKGCFIAAIYIFMYAILFVIIPSIIVGWLK